MNKGLIRKRINNTITVIMRRISITKMKSAIAFRYFIAILLLTFASIPSYAQESCGEKLKRAEELYEAGQIDKIAGLLQPCLEKGFSKEEKIRAYRLLTLSNLYYNEDHKAVEAMNKLLKVNPEYKIRISDPSEFVTLHHAFRTKPVLIAGLKTNFGFFDFYEVQNYNDINTAPYNAVYQPSNSYGLGLSLEFPIVWQISLGAEFFYSLSSYNYETLVMDYAKISFTENIQSIDVPVFLQYTILKNDFAPYVNAGVAVNYLLNSQSDFKREDAEGAIYREPLTSNIDMTSSRNSYNYAFSAAAGFRWKNFLGRGYLTFDIRYSRYFQNLVEPSNRADNPEAVYSFFTTDNTLKFQNTQIMLGYKFPLYIPRYKKK